MEHLITDGQEARKAGRPRSTEAHQAILDATLSLLSTQGFDSTSIEEIAARAGVGKTTIYRWWDSKEALALEALQSLYVRQPIIDTGNLRHDLIVMLEGLIQLVGEDDPLFAGLVFKLLGDFKRHPALFQMFYSQILEPRLRQFFQMIERAQLRGELRQDLDPLILIGLLAGPFFYRMLLSSQIAPGSANWPERVVDAALNGVAAHRES
jgi:AcrR family transcriptional regulator